MYELFSAFIEKISNFMYSYLLIILLLAVGLYFTFRTKFVQLRMLGESIRLVTEKKDGKNSVSAFEALMVSTASRVGTGHIVGVANALAIGGSGAVFWMWVIALIGADLQKTGQPRRQLRWSFLLYRSSSWKTLAGHHLRHCADCHLCYRF